MKKPQKILLILILVLTCGILYQQKQGINRLDVRTTRILKKLDLSVLSSCGIITDGQEHGSCVMIRSNLVLTAGHCIDKLNTWIEIDGTKYNIESKWRSEKYDVGFAVIDSNLPCLIFGSDPVVQDEIYIVGAPFNVAFLNKVSKGLVCKTNIIYTQIDLDWTGNFICDALAGEGNSGGPVLDVDGKIVGIYVGTRRSAENFCVCVPVSKIKEAFKEYIQCQKN